VILELFASLSKLLNGSLLHTKGSREEPDLNWSRKYQQGLTNKLGECRTLWDRYEKRLQW